MMSKASGFTGKTMLAALLSVAVACGSVHRQETAQSKAVRDRSRVLGLALMDDGTYQFRLCRLHQTYTAAILANACINPLVNEDGTERVFNNVPDKPGTLVAKFRNWATAALVGTIAGVILYKVGRFYVKTKAGDRLVGEARLRRHKAKVDGAKAHNDFELVAQLGREIGDGSAVVGGKDFTNAIAFVESYGKKVEGNIETARDAIQTARKKPLQADIDKMQKSLQEASEVLQQTDSGFNLDSKPIQNLAQEIEALAKQAGESRNAGEKELGGKLQAMEKEASVIYKRVHGKEGLRLSRDENDALDALAAVANDDAAVAKALKNWQHSKEELSLLDGSTEMENVLVKLKYGKDDLVEKLLRIDDVAMKNDPDHLGYGEKTVLQLKHNIQKYRTAKTSTNKKDTTLFAKLAETEAALKERIKSYNSSQKTMIDAEQAKVDMAIKADPVTEKAEDAAALAKEGRSEKDGLLANSLGKVGNGIKGSVKFLRGFPWIGEDTLKYGKLNKITITDEDKLVAKLAHDVQVEDVAVQKGVEKLSTQVVGISAFLSLPLTAWSRYLPAHALLSAEKNWTAVTGGYAAAKRIDDMLTILDGIAQATDSKVAPAAITFGL